MMENNNAENLSKALSNMLQNGQKDNALFVIASVFEKEAEKVFYQEDDHETWSSFQRIARIIKAL